MEIKLIGDDLEASCAGCGETLLIGPGESVNFRMGEATDLGGVYIPMPEALLCSACHRKENHDAQMSIKFMRLSCSVCGGYNGEMEPDFDDEGNLKGLRCEDCSEPWRSRE